MRHASRETCVSRSVGHGARRGPLQGPLAAADPAGGAPAAGKLRAPSSVAQMRQVLLRFLWLLDLAYDARPWWQRDSWHPVEDRRIPLREHEPLGRQAHPLPPHHRAVAALRRAMARQVALETGLLRWSTLKQRGIRADRPGCVPGRAWRHRAAAGRRPGPGAPADVGPAMSPVTEDERQRCCTIPLYEA